MTTEDDRPGFVVVNSFPKSGNTWVRSFLSHLCFAGDLGAIPDKYRGDPTTAAVHRLPGGRPVRFYKSHDWDLVPEFRGRQLDHVAAVHIRRHPLDAFVSHLNFLHLSGEDDGRPRSVAAPFITDYSGIDEIVRKDVVWAFLGVFMVYGTLNPRFLAAGSWFDNVEYWTAADPPVAPVFSLQYERLLARGSAEMYELGRYLGKTSAEVDAAWQAAGESTRRDGRFFWRQQAGTYREFIAPGYLAAFRDAFGERLARQGYEV